MHFKITDDGKELQILRGDIPLRNMIDDLRKRPVDIQVADALREYETVYMVRQLKKTDHNDHFHIAISKANGEAFTTGDIKKIHKLISIAASREDLVVDPTAADALSEKLESGLAYANRSATVKSTPAIRVRMDPIGLWHPGHKAQNKALYL